MVTGSFQLVSEELEGKLGFAGQTTQCCASGTCQVGGGNVVLAPIHLVFDDMDLDALVAELGALV